MLFKPLHRLGTSGTAAKLNAISSAAVSYTENFRIQNRNFFGPTEAHSTLFFLFARQQNIMFSAFFSQFFNDYLARFKRKNVTHVGLINPAPSLDRKLVGEKYIKIVDTLWITFVATSPNRRG